jgi:hypothetical protein
MHVIVIAKKCYAGLHQFSPVFMCLLLVLTTAPSPVVAYVQSQLKLVGTGASGNIQQGSSVCMSADGRIAAAGGLYDNGFIGAVWFFNRTVVTGTWAQMGPKVSPIDNNGTSFLGFFCSLNHNGTMAVVGAPGDSGYIGATYVFVLVNGVWQQQGPKLVGQGYVYGDGYVRQGGSVYISSLTSNLVVTGTLSSPHMLHSFLSHSPHPLSLPHPPITYLTDLFFSLFRPSLPTLCHLQAAITTIITLVISNYYYHCPSIYVFIHVFL